MGVRRENMVVTINGVTHEFPDGSSISAGNGQIVINGTVVNSSFGNSILGSSQPIVIKIVGNPGSVHTVSGDVIVRGNVMGSVETVSGDVEATVIQGGVKTVSGDITRE